MPNAPELQPGSTRENSAAVPCASLLPAGATAERHRIFVVEDHPLMRKSIVAAFEREADLAVCGEAEDWAEALVGIASQQPDLVLTDLALKTSSGLELIKSLRLSVPGLPVVATTMFNVQSNQRLALAAGAARFVSKQEGPELLVQAVHAALAARRGPVWRATPDAAHRVSLSAH